MNFQKLLFIALVILPGFGISGISAYSLLPEWKALTASYQNYETLSKKPNATVQQLAIAQAAENRHRINCFAEGTGVLFGWTIASIGLHGIYSRDDF
ncbi:hypothetical protein [Oscillatoria sp. FACHB-1406]|uniref:hypothetical protein n=1 Tax=Oscillatoria sp. FACHB-1406 TaxID=2692846 RepID=UPI00168365AD|nr:hypothetical protein [Oscillatoria sp. FACHB-1406]MBD2578474.1 hypothetical protein [Oscillatoria sp. FACHB-1406]